MINIIIPSYKRFDLLEETLASLRKFDVKYTITVLYDDDHIPEELTVIAKTYNVMIEHNSENIGINDNIYKCTQRYEYSLVIDSDVRLLKNFTAFLDEAFDVFRENEKVVGISLADKNKFLQEFIDPKTGLEHERIQAKTTNVSACTVYKRNHMKEAYKLFKLHENKKPGGKFRRQLDRISSDLATSSGEFFLCSSEVFFKHIGNGRGTHIVNFK